MAQRDSVWLRWTHPDAEREPVTVLFEGRPGSAVAAAHALAATGCDVVVCSGPDRDHPCPLLHDERCSLVDEADVVVNTLGPTLADNGELVARIRHTRPSVPLVVASPDCDPRAKFDVVRRPVR